MKRIALDIETNTKHDRIWLVRTKDLDTGEKNKWTEAEKLRVYLKDATLIVAHNGIGFDFPVLNRLWNTKITLSKVFDTLIVSRLLDPSRDGGHSLEAWGQTLGFPKIDYFSIWRWLTSSEDKKSTGIEYDQPHFGLLDHYCERDVDVLELLYNHLVREIEVKGFSQESVELEHQVAAIIAEQERNGFKLDVVYATSLLADLKGKLGALYDRAQELYPPVTVERYSEKTGKRLKDSVVVFNLGSRQQIAQKLIELGWNPSKYTEKGNIVVDEAVIDDILRGNPSDALTEFSKLVKDYLLLQKLIAQITSWLEAVGSDGRVHGKVITNGAITGRATHSSPNLGQVPNTSSMYGKECRECWTVGDNNVQVGVDLSGIELRCLSHYMQDPEWQNELLKGDVHWKNTQAFGLVPMGTEKQDIKEHKDARNLSKTLTYSVLYGAGPAKVGSTVGGGSREGKKLIDNFMKNTPALKRLVKKLSKFIDKGFVPGLDGRKIWIRSEHAALNSLLQSAGAIIAKQWLVCMTDDLTAAKIPYKLLAWVHDEVQIETPSEYGEAVGKIVVEAANKAGEKLKFRCPVEAEFRIGRNWYECH